MLIKVSGPPFALDVLIFGRCFEGYVAVPVQLGDAKPAEEKGTMYRSHVQCLFNPFLLILNVPPSLINTAGRF